MSLEQNCIIIFDDKEEIPFQREIYDQESNQYITFPLSYEKVGLVSLISKNRQYQLKKQISQMKKVLEFVNKGENLLQQTLKIDTTLKMEDYLPDVVFGPKSLQTNKGEAGFQKICYLGDQQNMASPQSLNQENDKPGSNISIIIYKGETFENLQKQMDQYRKENTKIKPIVLINGKSLFKKLMRSDEELFVNFYKLNFLPFHKKFFTSNHHSLYFQIKDQIGYYFVFSREFDKLDLIKWIYQGILRFIQPKFAVIASSNEKFDQQINILQLFAILENENNKYFGIQCLKTINYEGSFLYNFKGDFADIALKIDSMFKIKQFHDPLSCIYKWSVIEDEIETYINTLSREYCSNAWALGYNAILPKLMKENHNLELNILTRKISEQQFSKNQFEIVFNQFCEFKQNVNYQLRKCRFGKFKNVLQWFISKVQVLHNYFGISICFFFSFQCPYSILYNLLENSVGYTALAIIIPVFYAINVLLFLLLVQLYHFNDKIIEKDQTQKVSIMANKSSQNLEFHTKGQSEKVDILLSQDKTEQNQIICEVQEDDYFKDSTYILDNRLLELQQFFFIYRFPYLKYISHNIAFLIDFQNFLDLGVVISILSNLIVVHGWILINERTLKEGILFIMVIVVIIFHFLNKGIGTCKMIFQFSMLTYFWQFLQLPKKITSSAQRSEQKRKLGSQLFLNFLLLYSFIAIESYYNYSGYILIGVFGYLSVIYFIIGSFQYIQKNCYHTTLPQQYQLLIWEAQIEEADLRLDVYDNQDPKDILVKNLRKLVAETNEGKQHQQQQLQQTQYLYEKKLTDTIKFQLKKNNQNMNELDMKKIDQMIEEQIHKYIDDQNKQEQVKQALDQQEKFKQGQNQQEQFEQRQEQSGQDQQLQFEQKQDQQEQFKQGQNQQQQFKQGQEQNEQLKQEQDKQEKINYKQSNISQQNSKVGLPQFGLFKQDSFLQSQKIGGSQIGQDKK
ncbi:unnamed protein product [Paramecium sonneborni]|uniref:Transmembrane protein n=1 Tax=Paramecium sonneborni TaxID=65129 RepID=A0A8S1QPJ7_9CILI|nr:unnamed protein product [Paramecium sonneborni]